MKIIKQLFNLARVNQWYKNLVIFFAIIFSNNMFNLDYFKITLFGFAILIMISSANYILNDIVDIKRDKLNPEKKNRPLASGRVKISAALALFIILLAAGQFFAYMINTSFFITCMVLFSVSTLYTLFLKNIFLIDLTTISFNFVLRAVSGAFIINVYISPWLIIGTFLLAFLIGLGKRKGEIHYLNNKKERYKKVLAHYSDKTITLLLNIFALATILAFAFFSFFSAHKLLAWVIPLFAYLVLRYRYLIISNNKIIRNPNEALSDIPFMLTGIAFFLLSLILIYL